MSTKNRRPSSSERIATLAVTGSLALVPTLAFSAGPHELAPADERPATWDMSIEALRAQGLGQYRGDPVPVPADAPRLRPAGAPVLAQPGVIFVNFDGAQLSSGFDDSRNNQTQIGNLAGTFAPYGEGEKRIAVLQAVAVDWAAYDVTVTQTRPASGNYTMNMTGPTNPFGGGVLGIAPLDCDDSQTHNNITYAFHSANDMFSAAITATTIGQEVAHSYGLEHVDEPNDIMNPYNAGGDPTFIDNCIAVIQGGQCGAQHQEHCGSPVSQNAHRELLTLFGPGIPDTSVPVVSITSPTDGQEFPAGADFDIVVTAADTDSGIEQVQLFNNGEALQSDTSEPYGWPVGNAPSGPYEMYVEATDLAGNVAMSNTITIYVGVSAPGADDGGEGSGGVDAGNDDDGTEGNTDGDTDGDTDGSSDADADGDGGGCGCRSAPPSHGPLSLLALLSVIGVVRRRDSRHAAH